MDYLDTIHNTNDKLFILLENGRKHILQFGYHVVVFRNGLKKSFSILRKLMISTHG